MPPRTRDRVVVGSAAALAAIVPTILLWPAAADIGDQALMVVTQVAPVRLTLSGAAEKAFLFSPSRTAEEEPLAPVDAAAPAPAPAAPTPPPTLVGIALGRGRGVALVKAATGDTVQAHVGETVEGWRVTALRRDRVTLESGGQSVELGLDFSNKQRREAAGAQPTPSAAQSTSLLPGSPE